MPFDPVKDFETLTLVGTARRAFLKVKIEKWAKVIKTANVKL